MSYTKRLIDANAFRRRIEAFVATARYKGINNVPTGYESCNPTEYMRGYERGVMDAYTVAVEQPQVDAVEVVHARWVDVREYCGDYMCSNCKELSRTKTYNYCPDCGAKMDGGNEDG